MIKNIELHRTELEKSLSRINQRIEKGRKPILNPYNISVDILKQFKNSENRKAFVFDKIRKLHDFYGWMAKGCVDDIGLCSGTIYRSSKYMHIPLNERTGKKIVPLGFQRVHIEHSVPIYEIYRLLEHNKERLNTPKDVFDLIMMNSVCTAFSNEEERTGIRKGFSQKLESGNENNRENIFPFKRYNKNVVILNVLTGRTVPHNTSLEKLVMEYDNIETYKWELISKQYKN